tara:strand:- start:7722 stop:7955 length:234 start_codon:yes stop_codon:yes gene_type:complete
MSLFDTPQDIRKRREPYIGEMEAYLWILEAEDPKTRKARERAISQAVREIEKAKSDHRIRIDAIRTGVGLPKFLDGL